MWGIFGRQDKTRQDKTRQDKTRQDKTRQDKTRQYTAAPLLKVPVTYRNKDLFAALTMDFKLKECAVHLQALMAGLWSIVPPQYLALFTWQELESMICGQPEVDVELLKRHTIYEGYQASSRVCVCEPGAGALCVGHLGHGMEPPAQHVPQPHPIPHAPQVPHSPVTAHAPSRPRCPQSTGQLLAFRHQPSVVGRQPRLGVWAFLSPPPPPPHTKTGQSCGNSWCSPDIQQSHSPSHSPSKSEVRTCSGIACSAQMGKRGMMYPVDTLGEVTTHALDSKGCTRYRGGGNAFGGG